MTVVFVFLGEFGYELLNWHGVVQKYRRLHPGADIVCASRGHVGSLYPGCEYVDIGEVARFRESVASGYAGLQAEDEHPASEQNRAFDRLLRRDLRAFVLGELRIRRGWKLAARRLRGLRFVFSSERTVLGECTFGADPVLFGNVPGEGNIYDALDLTNSFFARIQPDERALSALKERDDLPRDEPYVLVQTRKRGIRQWSTATIDERGIVSALARHAAVVALDFATTRANDSYSDFESLGDVQRIRPRNFDEQACLITRAHACVFMTEGDFGSHIYVPPFLGRDVWAVAPASVYEIGTTPIGFWNRNVFRFGGRIRPLVAEEVDVEELARRLAV